jgi:hypothetical protein
VADNVILVTSPDDFIQDSYRLMLVDLDESQNQLVSSALLKVKHNGIVTAYIYRIQDPIQWFFDKKPKSDCIIFNAESKNESLVGYIAAQKNSYYFGTLKTFSMINKSAIYSEQDVVNLLTLRMENNEQI